MNQNQSQGKRNLPKIGSLWVGSNNVLFFILNIVEDTEGTWVHYLRDRDSKDFNCLIDAFRQRFKEIL